LYIAKRLQSKGTNVTRLASGLPMGGHLDYADEMTLIKAMEGRKKI
jgi:recombination protein RecR